MSKWKMIYDMEHTCDGIDCDSFEEAKARWEDCLTEWMTETEMEHPGDADAWDKMIYNCSAWISQLNEETGEYEEYWHPTYKDEQELGWVEWEQYSKIRQAIKE